MLPFLRLGDQVALISKNTASFLVFRVDLPLMWAYVAMLLLSSSMSLSTGSICVHCGLTHASSLSVSSQPSASVTEWKDKVESVPYEDGGAGRRRWTCVWQDAAPPCGLKPVSKVSLPGRRGPLPNGDVYIYDISTQRRGHSLPWDAGNDIFFSPLMFSHRLIVVRLKLRAEWCLTGTS